MIKTIKAKNSKTHTNGIYDVGFVKYRIKDICRSDFVFDYVVAMQRYRNLDVDWFGGVMQVKGGVVWWITINEWFQEYMRLGT